MTVRPAGFAIRTSLSFFDLTHVLPAFDCCRQEPLLAALISRIGRTSNPELISTGFADGAVHNLQHLAPQVPLALKLNSAIMYCS
jgi:hypothetical protein